MKGYIYVLQDLTGTVYYVGLTTEGLVERFQGHMYESTIENSQLDKAKWIRRCISNGYLPLIRCIEIIDEVDSNLFNLHLAERYWIARYRREGAPLTNMTDGGEGGSYGMLGKHHSDETKAKMRKTKLGKDMSVPHAASLLACKGKKIGKYNQDRVTKMVEGKQKAKEARMKMNNAPKLGRKHER